MSANLNFQKYIRFILSLIIFLNMLKKSKLATSCKDNKVITNTDCFTNVLIFNNKNWRAGHSALNKAGLFILEFSRVQNSRSRLFYALKQNGRYYFPNESPTKEIELAEKNNIVARYESMNYFVSLKTDINKEKEYFLSTVIPLAIRTPWLSGI